MKHPNPRPTAFLKPAREGLSVPYPGSARRMLPAGGATVSLNSWWRRRILKGDAVVVPSKSKKAAAPKKES